MEVPMRTSTIGNTDNPVTKFLQSRGLTRSTFLQVTDIGDHAILSRIEHGLNATIPPRLMNELVKLGAHEAPMQRAYKAWRDERKEEILKRLLPLEGPK
jgi:hypothetical protein